MKPRYAIAIISPLIFLLDRTTKHLIETRVSLWDNHSVIAGFFSIIHTQNKGAAFSMLQDAPDWIRTFVLIGVSSMVAIVVAFMLLRALKPSDTQTNFVRVALALVLGGACGNLYDRIFHGAVTDFLMFYWRDYQFPSFNVADSSIFIGACLLLLDMNRSSNKPGRNASEPALPAN